MDDPELIASLRRGDEAAFATVFRTAYAGLAAAAERLLGDRAAAEDVAQDVMLELWKRRDALPADVALRGYLYQSVRNRALNRLRHLRTAREAEPNVRPPSPAPPADAGASTGELEAAMRAAVAELPQEVRETFLMSRVDGLTYAEIATAVGMSVKTVEARMGRALRVVRERLAPWLPDGGGW